MLKDLLKVNDPEKSGGAKYSQSRFYLFITFLTLMIVIIIGASSGIKESIFKIILDNLVVILFLFASYALVGKGMQHASNTKKKSNG